jgi:hypothetical protein
VLCEVQQIGNYCHEDDELLLARHQQLVERFEDKQIGSQATLVPSSSSSSSPLSATFPPASSSSMVAPGFPLGSGLLTAAQLAAQQLGMVPPSPLSFHFELPHAPSVVPMIQAFPYLGVPEQEEKEVCIS